MMTLGRSLINILKRRVDKWSPWWTPEGILNYVEVKFRYLTIWWRPDRKDWIQFRREPDKPNICNFLIRIAQNSFVEYNIGLTLKKIYTIIMFF